MFVLSPAGSAAFSDLKINKRRVFAFVVSCLYCMFCEVVVASLHLTFMSALLLLWLVHGVEMWEAVDPTLSSFHYIIVLYASPVLFLVLRIGEFK